MTGIAPSGWTEESQGDLEGSVKAMVDWGLEIRNNLLCVRNLSSFTIPP